jgi:hypothetical protein
MQHKPKVGISVQPVMAGLAEQLADVPLNMLLENAYEVCWP